MMKKHFDKELVVTKEDDEHFESFTKWMICDNTFVKGDIKERHHCHITGKYRSSDII